MEKLGFDPLDMFTPEQVEKMRSMEPEGRYAQELLASGWNDRRGLVAEMRTSCSEAERNNFSFIR